jgi:hypothetical protein
MDHKSLKSMNLVVTKIDQLLDLTAYEKRYDNFKVEGDA